MLLVDESRETAVSTKQIRLILTGTTKEKENQTEKYTNRSHVLSDKSKQMTQKAQSDPMGILTLDLSRCCVMFSGISYVRKALAAGWAWGFTHRNQTLARILEGEDVWAEC